MNLKHLTDNSLRKETIKAALNEKEATAILLHHIKEVDTRKLFSEWNFSSLFDWCVKDLGMCEGSAQLRITAARLLKDIPEIEKKIENGSLTLSNITQINQFCRQNNIDSVEEKKELLFQVENLSKRDAEKKLFELFGKTKTAKDSKKRISENKSKVTFVLSDETLEALQELKDLIGKELSSDELIKSMVKSHKEKIEKEKFKIVSRPRPIEISKGRVISSSVKRTVYARDTKCVKCGSKRNLNFDHVIPYSIGGKNSVDNIRLLCFHCNQRAWKTFSGSSG